jgi:2'-5' RNA ligase
LAGSGNQEKGTKLAENGIYILAELDGEVGRRIAEIQREFDPRLVAIRGAPHLTMAGSSGVGPAAPDTSIEDLRAALEPVAARTPRLELPLGAPIRYMQTNIVVLPLRPYGPLRELHDGIARSGLRFGRARSPFSPHVTLSLYPELKGEELRRILGFRIMEKAVISRIAAWLTMDPQEGKKLVELELAGDL